MSLLTHGVALAALAVAGCAQTAPPPGTSAPVTGVSAAAMAGSVAESSVASPAFPAPYNVPTASPALSGVATAEGAALASRPDPAAGVSASFRGCRLDADCVAVPRAGCCQNGWKEAVATAQADAYQKANACAKSPRPVCPMYIVRDSRVARCEPQTRLCTMTRP
jgi:hypothetical protein